MYSQVHEKLKKAIIRNRPRSAKPGYAILDTRDRLLQSRKRRASQIAKRLVGILRKKYGATRIVLVGSCAQPERFGFHSDIDLAVSGIPSNKFFAAAGASLLAAGEFDVDLIPIEDANKRMLKTIQSGSVLYEKR
jgi:uncharacterized protein